MAVRADNRTDRLFQARSGPCRRKEAVARVWVKLDTGKIIIYGKDEKACFARPVLPHDLAPAADHHQS